MSLVEQQPRQAPAKVATAAEFRIRASTIANSFLKDWVGEERAREATGRIATAISASAAASKNPEEFYQCTPASVAKVIAISALTGIMVSTGAGALAYAIPRRARKGEDPQLQYQLSHRGLAALAKRAGFSLVAIPISYTDVLSVRETGEVFVTDRDIDNPPSSEEELRGVVVLVRSLANGSVVSSGFVAKSIINERRAGSDSWKYAERPGNDWAKESSTWHKWYVEMSMKTAMHYAIGRGWCVIDDTEAVRALTVDAESDYEPVTITVEPSHGNRSSALEAKLEAKSEPMVPMVQQDQELAQASSPQDA
jgi:recombinational DNA repair protein RecT